MNMTATRNPKASAPGTEMVREPMPGMDDPSKEKLQELIGKLAEEANKRVMQREPIEQRWLRDIEQFHGQYDLETAAELKRKKNASKVFLNRTRPKTNSMKSRLWNLLFPTDDRNWSIQPTPVPEMADASDEVRGLLEDAEDTFADRKRKMEEAEKGGKEDVADQMAAEMEDVEGVRSIAQQKADELGELIAEAKRRARLMELEIEDQFKTSRYQSECRDVISDACKIGTGILKGPVKASRLKVVWEKDAEGRHRRREIADNRPAAHWVDPWSFFPSINCPKIEDSEGVYVRHLMTRSKLRRWAKLPGVDKDAVRALLELGPATGDVPSYLADLRNITSSADMETSNLFVIWEYTGALEPEDIMLLARADGDEDTYRDAEEIDPLAEMHVRVFFSQNRLLKLDIHPLDSNECVYSVFNLEKDESSPFGFGIPHLIADPQRIINAAKRMMMDNAALSVGPQIVINKSVVEPDDNEFTLEALKIWLRKQNDGETTPPFEIFNIPINQEQLAAIIDMSSQDIDDETGVPKIAEGEQGANVTKTAQGMALLMNSANVLFAQFVKNFDDDVTVPTVRRFYDWNMQFNEKEEIKGDFEIDARGSSVLLVREMQATNMMMIMDRYAEHPTFGPMMKPRGAFENLLRAHMMPVDEILKSEAEERKDAKTAETQPDPVMQLEMRKIELEEQKIQAELRQIELKAEMVNAEMDARLKIAQMEFDGRMSADAARLNMQAEAEANRHGLAQGQIGDKAEAERIKADSSERKLAVEMAALEETGKSAGGSV